MRLPCRGEIDRPTGARVAVRTIDGAEEEEEEEEGRRSACVPISRYYYPPRPSGGVGRWVHLHIRHPQKPRIFCPLPLVTCRNQLILFLSSAFRDPLPLTVWTSHMHAPWLHPPPQTVCWHGINSGHLYLSTCWMDGWWPAR